MNAPSYLLIISMNDKGKKTPKLDNHFFFVLQLQPLGKKTVFFNFATDGSLNCPTLVNIVLSFFLPKSFVKIRMWSIWGWKLRILENCTDHTLLGVWVLLLLSIVLYFSLSPLSKDWGPHKFPNMFSVSVHLHKFSSTQVKIMHPSPRHLEHI